jgi:DeoR/GlpR family transcriptional regulator of sugar metabolism
MSILAAERQQQILERLEREGRVLAVDLAAAFGASEDTVRRDLRELAGRGLCRRVYGGALPVSPASGSARLRAREGADRKAALGEALAALVGSGQFVFIDAGSTNLAAARRLAPGLGVTVATHDPAIAAALSGREDVSLWLIGGRVDPHVGAALGGRALADIEAMRPDLVLLGVCALDATAGLSAFNAEDAELKRALVRNARSVAAAVTNDKLGTGAPFAIGPSDSLDCVVLEADAPEEKARELSALGLAVSRALGPPGSAYVRPLGDAVD